MEELTSISKAFPSPIGGWNAKDPLPEMPPQDAIALVNWFPDGTITKVRNGFRVHATGMGTGQVAEVSEFSGADGTRKLVAFANNKIYDASVYNVAATDISNATAITTNKWQTTNFRNRLICVNGSDQPRQYDGAAVTDATYTGTGLGDDNNFIQVSTYKNRLYFVEKNQAKIWYGGLGEITGTVTSFDLAGEFLRGGSVQFAGSWTRGLGKLTDDLFVLVSNMGEVCLYSGGWPGDIDWIRVGRFFIAPPIGRRGFFHFGSDFLLITEMGAIPLTEVLQSDGSEFTKLTDKIRNSFIDAAASYKNNFGWEGLIYPKGKLGLINIPIIDGTTSEQYVFNLFSGAWCRFTGINAQSWTLFKEKPYFGGVNGRVYEFDFGANDNGNTIATDLKTAFNYFQDFAHEKIFLMARPIFIGDKNIRFNANVDVDFQENQLSDTISIVGVPGSAWDTSPWDTSSWDATGVWSKDWYAISGLGRAASLHLKGNLKDAQCSLSAIHIIFEEGGLI